MHALFALYLLTTTPPLPPQPKTGSALLTPFNCGCELIVKKPLRLMLANRSMMEIVSNCNGSEHHGNLEHLPSTYLANISQISVN